MPQQRGLLRGGWSKPIPGHAAIVVAARTFLNGGTGVVLSGCDDEALFVVEDLTVTLPTSRGPVDVVRNVSFTVGRDDTLGIVGESGSGKSMTALAVLGLLPPGARTSGSIRLDGEELLGRSEAQLRQIRGNAISMVFQDPLSSLNPYYRVGLQIEEGYRAHRGGSRREARRVAIEALEQVRIPDRCPADRSLPAPVLRWSAAADHDRDGLVLLARAADRGRADHRARRDGAGADPRTAGRTAARDRYRPDLHHARPGGDQFDRAAGAGDVRRATRWSTARPSRSSPIRSTSTPAHCWTQYRGSTIGTGRQAAAGEVPA